MRRIALFAVLLSLLLAAVGHGPARAEPAVPGTQDNPVPLGQPILLVSGDIREYVAVAEVNRGVDAWKRLQRYSPLNSPTAPGRDYVMALVVVRFVSGPEDQSNLQFELQSSSIVSSTAPRIVSVRPDFEIVATPDVMSGGWVVREADSRDPNPLLAVTIGSGSARHVFYFSASDSQSVDSGGYPTASQVRVGY